MFQHHTQCAKDCGPAIAHVLTRLCKGQISLQGAIHRAMPVFMLAQAGVDPTKLFCVKLGHFTINNFFLL